MKIESPRQVRTGRTDWDWSLGLGTGDGEMGMGNREFPQSQKMTV